MTCYYKLNYETKEITGPFDINDGSFDFGDRRRFLFKTELEHVEVSTVFLALDHGFGGSVPLVFETMVFPEGTYSDCDMERYSSYKEAELGHDDMVSKWTGRKPDDEK